MSSRTALTQPEWPAQGPQRPAGRREPANVDKTFGIRYRIGVRGVPGAAARGITKKKFSLALGDTTPSVAK